MSLLALVLLGGVFVTVRAWRAYETCKVGDGPGLMNTLTQVQGWVHVVGVGSATRQPEGGIQTLPAVVTDAGGSNVTVRIHASFWPDIDAALARNDQVWLALSDFAGPPANFVTYVVMVDPDGNVSFPGRCQSERRPAAEGRVRRPVQPGDARRPREDRCRPPGGVRSPPASSESAMASAS